jgi:hypothetical protein
MSCLKDTLLKKSDTFNQFPGIIKMGRKVRVTVKEKKLSLNLNPDFF